MSETFLLDVAAAVPGEGDRKMAMEIFRPEGAAKTVLCCLAGGGVTRRFWDLDVPGTTSHSFARTLTASGHAVVLADHLSVGESSSPPPLELTVEALAAANDFAMRAALDRLRGEYGDLVAIGVGHSMGAMLTAIQQAHHRTYAAVALLGFANRGLPDFVPPDLAAYANDPMALRAALPEILAARASAPPPPPSDRVDTTSATDPPPRRPVLFHSNKLPPEVADAVRAIAYPAPALAAAVSMVPGSIKPEMEQIDVPVLIANGDLDITGPIEDIPAGFPKSPEVTTVVLPETGHSHHAFPGRLVLYERLDEWASKI